MKELRDQAAHFGIAFVLAFALGLTPVQGLVVGLALSLVREVTEEGDPVTFAKIIAALGSRLDITCWSLGGLAGGVL